MAVSQSEESMIQFKTHNAHYQLGKQRSKSDTQVSALSLSPQEFGSPVLNLQPVGLPPWPNFFAVATVISNLSFDHRAHLKSSQQ